MSALTARWQEHDETSPVLVCRKRNESFSPRRNPYCWGDIEDPGFDWLCIEELHVHVPESRAWDEGTRIKLTGGTHPSDGPYRCRPEQDEECDNDWDWDSDRDCGRYPLFANWLRGFGVAVVYVSIEVQGDD